MAPRPSLLRAATLPTVVAALAAALLATPNAGPARVTWSDVAPVQATLRAGGVDESTFDAYVARISADNVGRVREGDLDHLIYYLLQSSRISSAAAIEPAVSARHLVESLDTDRRAASSRMHCSAVSVRNRASFIQVLLSRRLEIAGRGDISPTTAPASPGSSKDGVETPVFPSRSGLATDEVATSVPLRKTKS